MPDKEYDITKEKDPTNPSYYNGRACLDVIEFVTRDLKGVEAFNTGQVIKYLWRWDTKNGLTDLGKAAWYLNDLKNVVEKRKQSEMAESEATETDGPIDDVKGATYKEVLRAYSNDAVDSITSFLTNIFKLPTDDRTEVADTGEDSTFLGLTQEVNTINAQITRLDRRIDEAGGGGSTAEWDAVDESAGNDDDDATFLGLTPEEWALVIKKINRIDKYLPTDDKK